MMTKKSLIYRVGAGKAIGLVIGLLGFFLIPEFIESSSLQLRFGVLFWYTTIGAFIGVFGIFVRHPVLDLAMPWWFRGALIGGWMNFVLTLIAYEQISTIVVAVFGEYGQHVSPYIMVLEGVIIGMLMDYLLTRWFGEG